MKVRLTSAPLIGLLAASTILTAACGNDEAPALPAEPSAPVLTGVEGSDKPAEEQAGDAAIAKVADFYAVRGEVDADPAVPVEKLSQVAGDPVLGKYTADAMLRRSEGVTSTGQITVVSSKVTDLDAPSDESGEPIDGPAWVHVEACTDITTWNAVRADGTSAMDSNRGTYELARFTVRNADWPDASGWRVTSQTVEKAQQC